MKHLAARRTASMPAGSNRNPWLRGKSNSPCISSKLPDASAPSQISPELSLYTSNVAGVTGWA
eukprot:8723560-Pyramimonas_sp.AAC.1